MGKIEKMMENGSNMMIHDEKNLVMLPNQIIPLRACIFHPDLVSCIQHEEWIKKVKKPTKNGVLQTKNDRSLPSFLLDSQC